MSFFRSDLASEIYSASLRCASSPALPDGLFYDEERLFGLSVTALRIESPEASAALERPLGAYYTLELPHDSHRRGEGFPSAVMACAELICRCAGTLPAQTLVACLGNPDITPDALGPLCASNVLVTRHLKACLSAEFAAFRSVALFRTGVLGTTGVESAVQIRTLCRELGVGLVIAVDALACAEVSHLCRTVQICSSGIAPGSGVGNDRQRLDREYLGVPVVAVGVPTVIDAALFSEDEALRGMFVTPRSIDSLVRSAGRVIGYGINLALHCGLTLEDIDLLIG